MKRPAARTIAERLAVTALSFTLAWVYGFLLRGLPQGFLEAILRLKRVNGVFQAWTPELLGSPNSMLPMAMIGLALNLLASTGLDVRDVSLAILALLWSLGGCSVYLLAKKANGSTLSGLTGLVAYLVSTLALRGLWANLQATLLYTLTPIALLVADRGLKKRSLYYGFLAALAVTPLSGGLQTLNELMSFTLTLVAYLSTSIVARRETGRLGWIGGFTALTLASWAAMNIWWIATPPGLRTEFNPLALSTLPIGFTAFLAAFKLREATILQASIPILATVILLADPWGTVTVNSLPEILTVVSLGASLVLASALRRFADGLGEYVSLSIVVEEDKGEREYEILKPLICLFVAGLLAYHSILAVSFIWQPALEVPSWYRELGERLPEEYYRVLTLPVLCGDAYYKWGVVRYPENAVHLISQKPVVSGCEFTGLNSLSVRRGFWKVLSVLGVRFLVVQMDLDHEKSLSVDPEVLRSSIESNRLDYEELLLPNIRNSSVDLMASGVKPLTEPFGFVQLVNYSPYKSRRVEARLIKADEAQSKIHIHASGASWTSENPALNQTFSFGYIPLEILNCSGYGFIEFWIRVNGSKELTVQLYDIHERWSLWRTEVGGGWTLTAIPLEKPDLYGGLDPSTVVRIVFSLKAPLNTSVEAEVGGIFLDKGLWMRVPKEPEPLRIFMEHGGVVVYELWKNHLTPKIYSVERLLRHPAEGIFEALISQDFDPRVSAYVESEPVDVKPVELSYTRIGLTDYEIAVNGVPGRFLIILNERFHDGWRLYIGEPSLVDVLLDAKPVNVSHVRVNGFLNGWFVEAGGYEKLKLTMVYRPQRLMEALRVMSIAFALAGLTLKPLNRVFRVLKPT